MPERAWSAQDAKNKFSALVEAAQKAPQTVTKHGKPAAVVISAEEYERLKKFGRGKAKNFVEHLLAMPQGGEEFERLPFTPRDVDF